MGIIGLTCPVARILPITLRRDLQSPSVEKPLLHYGRTLTILPPPATRRGEKTVGASIFPTRFRFAGALSCVRWVALGVPLLALSGCGEFMSQQENASGVRLFQQARYADALREFQEATYSNPKDGDGYYNQAATYHRMGRQNRCESDLKLAEKFYNDCLDRNPNHTECYRGLAVLLAERGDKDAAFRLVQGWADREPKLADAKVELARLYDEFGNRQSAQNCLYEAIEAQPDNARALTALAKMRDDAGDKSQALANYQRSLTHDSRQPYVASRISALQKSAAPPTPGGTGAPGVLAPPTVETGTRMAAGAPSPLK
jgi:tetratricopeptide (TPR) repeat protein